VVSVVVVVISVVVVVVTVELVVVVPVVTVAAAVIVVSVVVVVVEVVVAVVVLVVVLVVVNDDSNLHEYRCESLTINQSIRKGTIYLCKSTSLYSCLPVQLLQRSHWCEPSSATGMLDDITRTMRRDSLPHASSLALSNMGKPGRGEAISRYLQLNGSRFSE
jgi:hypothetical protein